MLQWEGKIGFDLEKSKLYFYLNRDLAVELPFTLTHPKPPPTPSPSRQFDPQNSDDPQIIDVPVDHNLIQLDAKFVCLILNLIHFLVYLVLILLVMMMILFLKNLLEYVLKVMKMVLMIQKLKNISFQNIFNNANQSDFSLCLLFIIIISCHCIYILLFYVSIFVIIKKTNEI